MPRKALETAELDADTLSVVTMSQTFATCQRTNLFRTQRLPPLVQRPATSVGGVGQKIEKKSVGTQEPSPKKRSIRSAASCRKFWAILTKNMTKKCTLAKKAFWPNFWTILGDFGCINFPSGALHWAKNPANPGGGGIVGHMGVVGHRGGVTIRLKKKL